MTKPNAKLPDGQVLVTVRDRSYSYHATCEGKRAACSGGSQFAAIRCAAKVLKCQVCEIRIVDKCVSKCDDREELFICARWSSSRSWAASPT